MSEEKSLSKIIAELDELEKKATPGPWLPTIHHWYDHEELRAKIHGQAPVHNYPSEDEMAIADSEFIASIRNAWPRISAELKRLLNKSN
jgi:hypothetical protein